MKLHRPVLRLRRLKSQRDAEESAAVPLVADELPAIPSQRLEKLRSQSGQQHPPRLPTAVRHGTVATEDLLRAKG